MIESSLQSSPRGDDEAVVRVLIQQPILPPYRLAVFRALSEDPRLDVTFAYGDAHHDSALQSVMKPEGLKVIPLKNHFPLPGQAALYQSGLLEAFREVSPDVLVLAFDPREFGNFAAERAARKAGKKVVWWGHGIRPRNRFRSLYAKIAKSSDATILYYPQGKETLAELGVSQDKMFVAWNSIEVEEIADLGIPYSAHRETILCVGRMIPEKKVPLLVEGFTYASEKLGLQAKLVIIGEGPDKARVEQLKAQSSVGDRIQILGAMYNQADLAPYFNDAYVAVSTGYVGLSAVHCLAYGVPMLAADDEPHSPEIMALQDGVNSEFFRANSVEDLAQKLVEMKSNPDRLAAYSEAGRAYALSTFSAKGMANNIAEAILYAARQGVSSPR